MIDIDAIRAYLLKEGCIVEYARLVHAFKDRLCNPDEEVQAKLRIQFKDYVNRLATVSAENSNGKITKFIILRPEFRQQPNELPVENLGYHQPTQPIDPLRRRWVIEACSCNYNGLLKLLKEDPKLADYKDIVNGYTALHWAAKFDDLNIIKLIAGKYGVSPDLKSSGGYTPLHIAYMFNRTEAANLLLRCYNANPKIRDNSGKIPTQYWLQTQAP